MFYLSGCCSSILGRWKLLEVRMPWVLYHAEYWSWQNLFSKVQRSNQQISELNSFSDQNRTSQNISQTAKSSSDAAHRLVIPGVGLTSPKARCVQCRCLHLSYSMKTFYAQQGESGHSSQWLIWPTLAVYFQIGWFIPQKHPCLPNAYTLSLDDYPGSGVSAALL